jgi:3-deoxy-manno-octulosonate cytidylyltransferase (CMP-KDO synthetase)
VIIASERAASPSTGTVTAGLLGVIPARLASERLPRKPLLDLAGRPLIEWVWRRAVATGLFARVIVATDSDEIEAAARSFGARVARTRADHPSGTDRVAEAVAAEGHDAFDVVVNIQGDEPFVRRDHLEAAAALVRAGWEIGTVATPIASLAEWRDPAVVKVVRGDDGGALYFSRAGVPHPRGRDPGPADLAGGAFLRHVGIYAYSPGALLRWVALPEGPLERLERLEQLRPLAAGIRIGVAVGAPAEAGVDTPEDALRAARILHRTDTPVPGDAPA